MEIAPDSLAVADRYKLLIGCIVPRPIAFVSTISIDGRLNLAPFSFFNGVGANPMTIIFCPANRPDGSEKDTLRNCKPPPEGGTGEFVVNAATEDYAREVAACAEPLPFGESEFDLTGLETTASARVRPPRLARAPWSFECETTHIIRTNSGAPSGGNIVVGRVVHIHIDNDLVNERWHVDAAKLRAIGRMGGLGYTRTRDRFEMPMGKRALELANPSILPG
jgi:flavin reductase (DIM6/NTAB) family NADH-FMN oxidoreductase RutF